VNVSAVLGAFPFGVVVVFAHREYCSRLATSARL
jgi:hypothetical protein